VSTVEITLHAAKSPFTQPLLYDGFEGHPGLKSLPYHEYEEW
jgi:hypothetical protein